MSGSSIVSRLAPFVFVVACGAAWSVATDRGLINPLLLPPFGRTMQDLWGILRTGAFLSDLSITLFELAAALSMAIVAGLTAAYLVTRSRYSIRVFEPVFASLYSVPAILFFPLFVLFFGIGSGSKIAMGFAVAFFPIVLTTIAGLGNANESLLRAARSMGASDWRMFWSVMLPAALPVILGGLRLGLVVALLAILGSETIAALAGLGHQIVLASDAMDTSKMFAYILLVLLIALTLNAAVSGLERLSRRMIG